MKVPHVHAPVGVLARTHEIARSLSRELHITNPVTLGVRNMDTATRGANLGAVLVDESAWPLTEDMVHALAPCLHKHLGYILYVKRQDLLREAKV